MQLTLSSEQEQRLRALLTTCKDIRVYKRTLAILEIARGQSAAQVSQLLGVNRRSIYNWVEAFVAAPNSESLKDDPRSGRPTLWQEKVVRCLEAALRCRPDEFGYRAVGWTTPLLREHLKKIANVAMSDDTIRTQLHRMNYAWKRPRYVLIPDPERDKKNRELCKL